MSENVQSMLLAPAALYLPLAVALVLTLARPPRRVGIGARTKFVEVFLIGIACQCAHTFEEFVTGLHLLFPPLFGLAPLSAEYFVGFNVFWIGIWVLSAFGVLRGARVAYFPVWFFGLAMCLNGILHPSMAIWAAGYFPGLVTAPVVGIIGVVVTTRLFQLTGSTSDVASPAADQAFNRTPDGAG